MVTSLCANMCAAVQQRAEPVSPFVSPWVVRYDKVPSLYRPTLRRGSQVSLKLLCRRINILFVYKRIQLDVGTHYEKLL